MYFRQGQPLKGYVCVYIMYVCMFERFYDMQCYVLVQQLYRMWDEAMASGVVIFWGRIEVLKE